MSATLHGDLKEYVASVSAEIERLQAEARERLAKAEVLKAERHSLECLMGRHEPPRAAP